MTHMFGDLPGQDDDPVVYGANTNRLLSADVGVQRFTAMPRMTAVEVAIEPA